MPKGKAEKIDLSYLSFEESVKQAWEAAPPPKKEKPHMSKDEMRASVDDDLAHIGKGPKGGAQNELRMTYNIVRQNDLRVDHTTPRSVSLQSVIKNVRERHPGFQPQYDEVYFRES